MRFDTSKINFTKNPDDVQLIEPELIWPITWQSGIAANIVVKDGIVYFLTTRHWWEGGTVPYSYLVAVDAETGAQKWARTRDFGWGERENSLIINGDRLYVIDRAPSCYNRWTGEPIFEKKEEPDIYKYNAAAMLQGISFYNNKLYYTSQKSSDTYLMAPDADPSKIKNILCIDGDTGDLLWGDLVPRGDPMCTNPLINNGKVFVVTDKGIRVYNAETGKLIGVHKDIKNLGNNHNLLYNNMLIFPNRVGDNASPAYSMLTAIRAE